MRTFLVLTSAAPIELTASGVMAAFRNGLLRIHTEMFHFDADRAPVVALASWLQIAMPGRIALDTVSGNVFLKDGAGTVARSFNLLDTGVGFGDNIDLHNTCRQSVRIVAGPATGALTLALRIVFPDMKLPESTRIITTPTACLMTVPQMVSVLVWALRLSEDTANAPGGRAPKTPLRPCDILTGFQVSQSLHAG